MSAVPKLCSSLYNLVVVVVVDVVGVVVDVVGA